MIIHEDKNVALKPAILKKPKEFAKQTTNFVDIESQKQIMQELPTPSKQDFDHFHKGCCTKKRCTKSLCLELALGTFRNFIALSKSEQDFYIYG